MSQNPRSDAPFDALTLIFLVGSLVVLGATFLIISDPSVPFNPLPPPTVPPLIQIPSATPTSTASATATATHTPTNTPIPPSLTASSTPTPSHTPTWTPSPTWTPTPVVITTAQPTSILNALTASPEPDVPTPGEVIDVQAGLEGVATPITDALPETEFAFVSRDVSYEGNPGGCQWLSIAGNALGLLGEPAINIAVEVSGDNFTEIQFTGSATEFGPAGFEVNLGTTPREADFQIRLLGPSGESISDNIEITTGDSCDTNVAVIEFVQQREY